MKKTGMFLLTALLLTGCNMNFNETKKPGVVCDNKDAIALAEDILNTQVLDSDIKKKKISNVKIDPQNIVIWDYKSGRYLCKAKVSGEVLDKKSSYIWSGTPYGIIKTKNGLKGWVYYQTYITTSEQKKANENKPYTFYVEIMSPSKIKEW